MTDDDDLGRDLAAFLDDHGECVTRRGRRHDDFTNRRA